MEILTTARKMIGGVTDERSDSSHRWSRWLRGCRKNRADIRTMAQRMIGGVTDKRSDSSHRWSRWLRGSVEKWMMMMCWGVDDDDDESWCCRHCWHCINCSLASSHDKDQNHIHTFCQTVFLRFYAHSSPTKEENMCQRRQDLGKGVRCIDWSLKVKKNSDR